MFVVKITVNGISAMLGHEAAEDILFNIPDKKKFNKIVAEFARSPLPQARMEVAGRNSIGSEIVKILVEDCQIDVLRNLVSNHKAQRMITESSILRLIKTEDYEILETVTDNLHSFSMCNPAVLAERLCRSENPKVRYSLAENQLVDKRVLEILSNDEDNEIAAKATDTLLSLDEVEDEDLGLEDDEEENEE